MSFRSEIRKWMWKAHRRIRDTATVRTRQGRFTVSLRDQTIGKRLYCRGQYELAWTQKVLGFLRAERLIPPKGEGCLLDIGANMGVICVGMLVQEEFASAVAIEPDPLNLQLLTTNIGQNGLADRCLALPFALSDKQGTVAFELDETNFGDHRVRVSGASGQAGRRTIEIDAVTLDSIAAKGFGAKVDNVSLVWMDVQGHEAYVIRGGRQFFANPVPVMSEVWPHGLRQAGTSTAEFGALASEVWSEIWIEADAGFEKRPIADLTSFLDDLDRAGKYANVIFTH